MIWLSPLFWVGFILAEARHTPTITALSRNLPTHPAVWPRQDGQGASDASTYSSEDTVSITATANSGPTSTMPKLQTANTPIPLAATIGLVMPDPWSNVYAGVNYSFGFVDAVQRPAPTIGGWLRHVQPLLVFPDYTVNVFPDTGQESPEDPGAVPEGSGTLCGATAENWVITHPFVFLQEGWYMFVMNQTWIQPTVANDTCQLPLLGQKSFFSWQAVSILPRPNQTPGPPDPTAAYTVFAGVTEQTPPPLPLDKHSASGGEKLAIGLGITGAIIGLILIGAVVWWVKKKRKMEREYLAFCRLSPEERAEFLAENPEHFLNMDRPSRKGRRADAAPTPGTMAYAQWYWNGIRQRQYDGWRWGTTSAAAAHPWWGQQGWRGQHGMTTMDHYPGQNRGYPYAGG